MILIQTSGVTTFAATCSLNATITNPYYLFDFEHKLSNEHFYVIPYIEPWYTDYPPQWNLFNISVNISQPESLTGNTLSGQTNVWLIPGEYFVKVYEQTSASNLNPSLSQGQIYQTMAKVDDYCDPLDKWSGETDQWIIYDDCAVVASSPTPSVTPTLTPTVTSTQTQTPTPTITETPTNTPSVTPTETLTPTPTISETPTQTPTNTPSVTPTETPTNTPTVTPTVTPSITASVTPSITPTFTPTPSATNPQLWQLGGGFDDNVYSIKKIGSDFYIAGAFNTYDGVLARGVVKTDSNGIMDTNFVGRKSLVNPTQIIHNLIEDGVDDLVMVGTFTNYNDNAASDCIVRVNKNTGTPNLFLTGTTFNQSANGILRLSNNQVIVWGIFTTWASNNYQRIIKFNSNWTPDNTYWNTSNNFNSTINRVIENIAGNYVVAGNFTTYSGGTKNRIVEIDPTTGVATALFGTGSNTQINDFGQDSLGNYYLLMTSTTGTFNGSSFTERVVKVDSSGNMIPTATWGSSPGGFSVSPSSLFIDEPNGWIYIMGAGGEMPRRISLSTGIIDQVWTDQQELTLNNSSQTNSNAIYVDNNNKVYIGNDFTIYQSAGYNRFIRLNSDGTSNTTTT